LRSAPTQLSDEVFELIVGNVRVPPRRNISPAFAGCLSQRLEFRVLKSVSVLDEAQPFAQNLAGVLVASRLNQSFYELLLVLAQNHVAGGHVNDSRKGEHKLVRTAVADYANALWAAAAIAQWRHNGVKYKQTQVSTGSTLAGRGRQPSGTSV
jgi:uncharacterized membrane protein